MPELPEVETVRRGISPLLTGRVVAAFSNTWPRLVQPSPERLAQLLPGRRIRETGRRGKYLLLMLEPAGVLALHLGMTGDLLVEPDTSPWPAHTHTVIHLENGYSLRFADPRKFGRIILADHPDDIIGHLGPEPLAPSFGWRRLAARLAGRRGPLKPVLMNQEVLAGIGNIYADEACFGARLHPARPAGGLTEPELRRLHRALRTALRHGLPPAVPRQDPPRRGRSEDPPGPVPPDLQPPAVPRRGLVAEVPRNYGLGGETAAFREGLSVIAPEEDVSREEGAATAGYRGTTFQDQFLVYGRTGQPCPRCGRPVERIILGGRSAHFCPRCQPGK